MAMSAGPSEEGEETPMSDINTTPLVDVMLVLLIIFLIAVPVVIQTVPVVLPKVRYEPTTTKPENVNLAVLDGWEALFVERLSRRAGRRFEPGARHLAQRPPLGIQHRAVRRPARRRGR